MAIALPLLDHLFVPVHQAVQWLSGGQARPDTDANPTLPPACACVGPRAQSHARPSAASVRPARRWGGPLRSAAGVRPLRVVHIPEVRAPRGAAGRLLISGRLDDVFAELDRLARDQDTAGYRKACPAP